MHESLQIVWDDLLKLIQQRRHILDMNANFHNKMSDVKTKLTALEAACKDTMIPIEIDSVQEFLCQFKQLRIDVLASVMEALKHGNELLSAIREIAPRDTLDSRPDHIRLEVKKSVVQVEVWLEDLHDRRNALEMAWQMRKIQLEQCLSLAIFSKELGELESELHMRKTELDSMPYLGASESEAVHMLQKYISLKQNAMGLRDRALKITRATEKLVSSGSFSGDEAYVNAYNVLGKCTEYLEAIDHIEHLLTMSREFYGKAEKALSVLSKLAAEVYDSKLSIEATAAHPNILNDIVELTEEPLKLGYSLLADVGRSNANVSGIERTIEDIETRKIYLEEICSINRQHRAEVTQSLQGFYMKYEKILEWLVSVAESVIKENSSMGSNMQTSNDFLKVHHQLLGDLEVSHHAFQVLYSIFINKHFSDNFADSW